MMSLGAENGLPSACTSLMQMFLVLRKQQCGVTLDLIVMSAKLLDNQIVKNWVIEPPYSALMMNRLLCALSIEKASKPVKNPFFEREETEFSS